MADRPPPQDRLGPPFTVYADYTGVVVGTDPSGIVAPGTSLIDLARRYRAVPVARRAGGLVYTAAEILPAEGGAMPEVYPKGDP